MYLGSVLVALFLILGVTGMLLLFYYSPESEMSYRSVIFLEEKVSGGKFIRSLHRMCSHLILITAALHFYRTVFTGVYAARRTNWKLGYIIFMIMIFEAYTGYLMPLDQLSFWATKTGMELMNTLPLGSFIKDLLMPDDVGGRLTMLRFFALHAVILPAVSLTLVSAHLYNIRRDGGLAVYKTTEKSLRRKDMINFSLAVFAAVLVISSVLAYVIGSPLETPADASSPPNPAKSAWFLLWIQEIVSWRAVYFNIFMVALIACYFLPDFRKGFRPERSRWFAGGDIYVWLIFIAGGIFVLVLTVIGMFFRGENWEFVFSLF